MRSAAFNELLQLAKQDPSVLFVVSDVAEEIIKEFKKNVPGQIFVEGIAENHLVGMAAGLAKKNHTVFINTIASFLTKRAFEAIAINLCLEKANVKLLAQGGGLVYGPQGPTHHAIEDVALMRALPGMTVMVPCDINQTQQAVRMAAQIKGPVYIRLAKGNAPIVTSDNQFKLDEPVVFKTPKKMALIATGIMTQVALQLSSRLNGAGVIGIPVVKPFPEKKVADYIESCDWVFVLEEHSSIGGLSSCVAEVMAKYNLKKPRFLSFSLKDAFVHEYGKQEELLRLNGLDEESIFQKISLALKSNE